MGYVQTLLTTLSEIDAIKELRIERECMSSDYKKCEYWGGR